MKIRTRVKGVYKNMQSEECSCFIVIKDFTFILDDKIITVYEDSLLNKENDKYKVNGYKHDDECYLDSVIVENDTDHFQQCSRSYFDKLIRSRDIMRSMFNSDPEKYMDIFSCFI